MIKLSSMSSIRGRVVPAEENDMDRGERRWRTELVAARRHADYLRVVYGADAADCELPERRFAKERALGCRSRKRRWGQPRVDAGMGCKAGLRDRIYAGRRQWREWGRAAASGCADTAEDPAQPRC